MRLASVLIASLICLVGSPWQAAYRTVGEPAPLSIETPLAEHSLSALSHDFLIHGVTYDGDWVALDGQRKVTLSSRPSYWQLIGLKGVTLDFQHSES